MDWIRTILARCVALFRRGKLHADLDDELRAHIELAIAENLKLGMSAAEARTAALRIGELAISVVLLTCAGLLMLASSSCVLSIRDSRPDMFSRSTYPFPVTALRGPPLCMTRLWPTCRLRPSIPCRLSG